MVREEQRCYVVVSGPPASGKTALAAPLAADLGLPLLAKDTIKDALMSVLGVADVAASRTLGRAAFAALLAVAEEAGCGVLEAAWRRSLARVELERLAAPIVEVFCRCEAGTLEARYRLRAASRSPGHFDAERSREELWSGETLHPVAGGWPLLEVDTSGPVDVARLAADVRRALAAPV